MEVLVMWATPPQHQPALIDELARTAARQPQLDHLEDFYDDSDDDEAET
jgi:hypothetical protein